MPDEDSTCAHCGAKFESLRKNSKYCCNRCKVAAWRRQNPERVQEHIKNYFLRREAHKACAIYAGYCNGCGSAFVSRRKRAYCSPKCARKAWNSAHYKSTAPDARICRCCGNRFVATKAVTRPTDFCGPLCKSNTIRSQKRTGRIKRKAKQRGAMVETVNPLQVFARDGWRCQLCGVKTPKEKRGTYAPDAPELDHIMPLSKGGEHSYLNTQCACRRCNGLKSDTPRGQLLLVG